MATRRIALARTCVTLPAPTLDVPWAAGAMISTIGDLRIWAEALVAGSLLTPELQA